MTQNQIDLILLITNDVQCKRVKCIDKNKINLNNFFKIFKKYQQLLQIFENDEIKNVLLQHKF